MMPCHLFLLTNACHHVTTKVSSWRDLLNYRVGQMVRVTEVKTQSGARTIPIELVDLR